MTCAPNFKLGFIIPTNSYHKQLEIKFMNWLENMFFEAPTTFGCINLDINLPTELEVLCVNAFKAVHAANNFDDLLL